MTVKYLSTKHKFKGSCLCGIIHSCPTGSRDYRSACDTGEHIHKPKLGKIWCVGIGSVMLSPNSALKKR